MRKHVKQFFFRILVCQTNKAEVVASPGLLQPLPILERVWTEISTDFIDGLSMSKGKTVIMVVVDRLSKYSNFIHFSHPFTDVQVNAFLDNV